jgi:hypothetical protein
MGYKHSWEIDLGRISSEQIDQLSIDTLTLFTAAERAGIELVHGIEIVTQAALRHPGGVIVFNGLGEQGCETFFFDMRPNYVPSVPPFVRDSEELSDEERAARAAWASYERVEARYGRRWAYVKTLELPYDAVVCAILMRAKASFGDAISIWSSGGFDEIGWLKARELYNSTYEVTPSSPLEPEEE